jgi:hypothetical protein
MEEKNSLDCSSFNNTLSETWDYIALKEGKINE